MAFSVPPAGGEDQRNRRNTSHVTPDPQQVSRECVKLRIVLYAKGMNMNWTKPELFDVNMSAEIGSYQDDPDGMPNEPIVSSDPAQDAE
jgi:hypothetical protein